MANVIKRLIRESSLLAPDLPSFKRQESAFVLLNLFVLAALLLIHTLLSSYFGVPPRTLIVLLAAAFLLNLVELFWLQMVRRLSPDATVILTWSTILLNLSLAFALASLSYRQDTQYFALLVVPILQAAFRFSIVATAAVVGVSALLEYFWVWNYFRTHPPPQISEYVEAMTIALIYLSVGVLAWTLVNHLRAKQIELDRARERLLFEEKLAAVGRFSSAIAHEIRNPVAMISSALVTALRHDASSEQREEMFGIAAKESARLERLTNDFLAYAKPQPPRKTPADAADFLAYVVEVSRPCAAQCEVHIQEEFSEGLSCDIDGGQLQQAILNLMMNAIEASSPHAKILVRGARQNGSVRIDIENGNGPIPREVAQRVFEPFFTTKPSGTGLGLAIARNVARGHGGDLVLSRNEANAIQFTLTLPAAGERS